MKSASVGIGLRQPHYREVIESPPVSIDFLEVHSENFFAEGGAALQTLLQARAHYPISLHGVGLSLGSADGLSATHLARLVRLAERVEPALVSEHLSFGAVGGQHANDLLPLPYTEQMLALVADHVGQVQDALKRRLLVENISAYVQWRSSEMSETAFLAELARRSGCGILLDVNNLYVNAVNFGFDALQRLAELPPASVLQMHLAGHSQGDDCLIDTHGSRVVPPVWELYRAACRRFGAQPTLIEWDTDLPSLAVLLDEARLAAAVQAEATSERRDG